MNHDLAHDGPDERVLLAEICTACKKAVHHSSVKLENLKTDLAEAQKCGWYQQVADSILSMPHQFPRGTTQTVIINSHTQKTEQITLNPKLDAFKNADLLYKKSRKGKRGIAIITRMIGQTSAVLHSVDGLYIKAKTLLPTVDTISFDKNAFEQLYQECVTQGLIKTRSEKTKDSLKEEMPFRTYTIDDWNIIVGRNARENDELTVHHTRPSDVWLHVAQHAGSHVVIQRDKNRPWPPEAIIAKAAAMAVWFSKAKHTSFAEVHVAEARYVHKRRKSPAGQVLLDEFKTLRVAPKSPQDIFRQ